MYFKLLKGKIFLSQGCKGRGELLFYSKAFFLKPVLLIQQKWIFCLLKVIPDEGTKDPKNTQVTWLASRFLLTSVFFTKITCFVALGAYIPIHLHILWFFWLWINLITFLLMPKKLVASDLLKLTVFLKKVHETLVVFMTLLTNFVMWFELYYRCGYLIKFDNSNISVTEAITTSTL